MLVSQLSSNKDNLNCKLWHILIYSSIQPITEFFVGLSVPGDILLEGHVVVAACYINT